MPTISDDDNTIPGLWAFRFNIVSLLVCVCVCVHGFSCILRCTTHVGKRHSSMHFAVWVGACVSMCILFVNGAIQLRISLGHILTYSGAAFWLLLSNWSHRKKRLWYCLMCHRVQDQRYWYQLVCINLSSCLRIVTTVFDGSQQQQDNIQTERWYTHERFIGRDLFFFHQFGICTEAQRFACLLFARLKTAKIDREREREDCHVSIEQENEKEKNNRENLFFFFFLIYHIKYSNVLKIWGIQYGTEKLMERWEQGKNNMRTSSVTKESWEREKSAVSIAILKRKGTSHRIIPNRSRLNCILNRYKALESI